MISFILLNGEILKQLTHTGSHKKSKILNQVQNDRFFGSLCKVQDDSGKCIGHSEAVIASESEAIHSSKNATGTKKVLKQMNAVQKAQHSGKLSNTSRTAKTGVLR